MKLHDRFRTVAGGLCVRSSQAQADRIVARRQLLRNIRPDPENSGRVGEDQLPILLSERQEQVGHETGLKRNVILPAQVTRARGHIHDHIFYKIEL